MKKPENIERDLYLRKVALGEIGGEATGYPSVDKPWLKCAWNEVKSSGT